MNRSFFFTAALLVTSEFAIAQNSNPWPTTGNVGIGTTTPGASLEIVRNSTDGSVPLVINQTNTNSTGSLQQWNMSGNQVAYMAKTGALVIPGSGVGVGTAIGYAGDDSHGKLTFGTTGSVFQRNVNNNVTALTINQNQGTGNIAAYQFGAVTKVTINNNGDILGNATNALYFNTLYGNTSQKSYLTFTSGGAYIVRNEPDANSALTLNLAAPASFGNILTLQGAGATKAAVNLTGTFYGTGTANIGDAKNAAVWTSTTGTQISRDINDGNTALTVNQLHASSTGRIVDFNNSTSTVATITNIGYVGIGTTIPDAKLTVKGKIHAEEVLVDLNVPGPDYVFATNYKLPTLEETKAYIDKNHHLPEIPSAKQMEKEGIDLGTMNVKLLKKIEELTLYVISQKEETDKLKEENTKLRESQQKINRFLQEQIIKLQKKTN